MALIDDALVPYALIASPLRAISFIIPDATFEELHSDDLAVTDHPVETGAAISDHAFKLPSRLEMRCGWSNSTAGTEGHAQAIYQRLLTLQASREPFNVFTGKRAYRNMLLGGIRVETSAASEDVLLVVAGLREVIITQTQQASAGSANQAMPEKTASTNEGGNVQPQSFGETSQTSTDFSSPDPSLGLGPSGADASAGDFDFGDGMPVAGGPATGAGNIAPGSLPGNAGFFGSFGPNAFVLSGNSPF